MVLNKSNQANESLSQYKLLSAYGGAGSILHTQYGSIIVSCIEEWGFLKVAREVINDLHPQDDKDRELAKNGLKRSKDWRLLKDLKSRKKLPNLDSLILIPNIEVNEYSNKIQNEGTSLAINSTFMPKNFIDEYTKTLKPYKKWYAEWQEAVNHNLNDLNFFFPPKRVLKEKGGDEARIIRDRNNNPIGFPLKQDNVVLICEGGHISTFPWQRYLRWKRENAIMQQEGPINLFGTASCCGNSDIRIKDNQGNTAGFDGKFLSCNNVGCDGGVSLKGLFNIKVKCSGHKPWEAETGENLYFSGHNAARNQDPPTEPCDKIMKVVLTTGNNLYFSRNISSIYIPELLYQDYSLEIYKLLEKTAQELLEEGELEESEIIPEAIREVGALKDNTNIKFRKHPLWDATVGTFINGLPVNENDLEKDVDQLTRDIQFRNKEFNIFVSMSDDKINIDKDRLFVKDVTENLTKDISVFFRKVLRIDQLMLTTTQLDFSRDRPIDADAAGTVTPKNIFKSLSPFVEVYPAVESFGEGIFFAFDEAQIEQSFTDSRYLDMFSKLLDEFGQASQDYAIANEMPLYITHTFSHLIMRELEFQCGYPTASLSERLYISKEEDTKMYGVLIYTSEGAEGSMGGLIAQTRKDNLNLLIKRALERATICSSDPLCWESDGQGLFELNLASCFSCGLVSETSCEKRNMFLDRRILVDEEFGLFRQIIYPKIEQDHI
ncbi:hypothetical protein ABID22_000338 [Pontibacter aydingkolensis]|uniref:DUF1998 domain-containing protein n=1 Tax=Pontibacter aydingkolensis TaxID=1911536 RepID=A0ABS7CQ73_9BACT|nr:DUF1998 domain-containing protein [Pontibacter aydingkolensis]MBW7465997.1 DUF1998 domain-containing protein [Pontibacter aydingkolensis]